MSIEKTTEICRVWRYAKVGVTLVAGEKKDGNCVSVVA